MIYVGIMFFVFLLDTIVKYMVEKKGVEKRRKNILGGLAYLTKFHNKGLALSKGKNKPKVVKWMSVLLTSMCLCVYIVTLGQRGERMVKTGLSILMGGAISNTSDRITRGYVVDYIGFYVKNKRLRGVVYNLSDFFLLIGAVLTAIGALLDES